MLSWAVIVLAVLAGAVVGFGAAFLYTKKFLKPLFPDKDPDKPGAPRKDPDEMNVVLDRLTKQVETLSLHDFADTIGYLANDATSRLEARLQEVTKGLQTVALLANPMVHLSNEIAGLNAALREQKPVPPVAAAASGAAASNVSRPAQRSEPPRETYYSRPDKPNNAKSDPNTIIAQNFAEIDLRTGRHPDMFRKEFLRILGKTDILDVQIESGTVLFYETTEKAIAWPFPNAIPQWPWRDFFSLPKGANYPITAVSRPAIVMKDESGGWRALAKGVVEQ